MLCEHRVAKIAELSIRQDLERLGKVMALRFIQAKT
jgi:hypothetical protein